MKSTTTFGIFNGRLSRNGNVVRAFICCVTALFVGNVASAYDAGALTNKASKAAQSAQVTPSPRIAQSLKAKNATAKAILVVHYARADKNYDRWNAWCWPEVGEGAAFSFTGKDTFGHYAVIPFKEKPKSAGFVIRLGDWEQKDIDHDRTITFDTGDAQEIWLVAGDERVYTNPNEIDLSVRVLAAFLDKDNEITLATTAPLTKEQIQKAQVTQRGNAETKHKIKAFVQIQKSLSSRAMYAIQLTKPVADANIASLQLEIPGTQTNTIYARNILDQERFTPLQATLGAICTPEKTVFQTWSPVSHGVQLLFYDSIDSKKSARELAMKQGEKGLWSVEVPGDLQGKLYRYQFDSYGERREVPDIHTFAATADGAFSVVADVNRLSPKDWDTTTAPLLKQPTDEIIYEVHVRDFSVADTSCPSEIRGTYLGMTHANPAKNKGVSSGLSHLQDLGVTAVHLLPIEDFTAGAKEYNWGYWTAFFNVVESNYASNASDPLQPIRDVKRMIQELHASQIRVILDVVYNHTSSTGATSPFDQTVPYYFHRVSDDGRLINDTGVGNAIADERPMMRKYIVDSLAYWQSHFKVDGFRFDLLGTTHPQTVRAICDRLFAMKPDITLYGEPWTGGGETYFGKGAQKGMHMAVFNDNIRNAIRGDVDGNSTGFATGPGGDKAAIQRGVVGAIDDFTSEPTETVNYVSAHDNLTLWDKLLKVAPKESEPTRRAMQQLSLGIVLTSQGIAFLDEGSDFCRSKNGNNNSYNAGDEVNALDWNRKTQYQDVFEYVRGLIAIRKAHCAFRMSDDALIRKSITFVENAGVVSFTINGAAAGDTWKTIFVAYNGEPKAQPVNLPAGTWAIVVDSKNAGVETLRTASGKFEMPPYSMIVSHTP